MLFDVDSGTRRKLTSTNDIFLFSADPVHGRVAYQRQGAGFTLLDVHTGKTQHVADGEYAHLAFDHTTI